MAAKRIILLVDHKVRDLPRLALLKVILEDTYGHEVALMARNIEPIKAAKRWTPDMIVFPFLRGHKWIGRVRQLAEAGVEITVLSSEYWYGELEGRAEELAKSEVVKEIDQLALYFSTHPQLMESMEAHYGRALPQARYTGNASFDFYTPPLRGLLTTRDDFMQTQNLDPSQPTLLVVTSFTQANYLSDTPEIAQRSIAFWKTATREQVIENQVVHRQMLTDSVVAIAQRYPDLNIIIRPHPFEMLKPPGVDFYRDAFAEHGLAKRFRFMPEGHISHLLNVSDYVLYGWSTVAIEAWLLGLPTIAVRTVPLLDPTLDSTVGKLSAGDDVTQDPAAVPEILARYMQPSPESTGQGGAIPAALEAERQRLMRLHLPYPPGSISAQIAAQIDVALQASSKTPNPRLLYGDRYDGLRGQLKFWWDQLSGEHETGQIDQEWEGWLPSSDRIASQAEMDDIVRRIRQALQQNS